MNERGELSYGDEQDVAIELRRETYPGRLNVTFTRGFVSSQAFVDQWAPGGPMSTLLPDNADEALAFTPTHPRATAALRWMGFEARGAILEVLDEAIADATAEVRVVAYDLNEPEIVDRLERLGPRLKAIVDDSGSHGEAGSAETQAAARLEQSAGQGSVKRQHMGNLQHNKTIVVDGPNMKTAVCGSTNFSWRGFYVQSNNAVVLHGDTPVALFGAAFDAYWAHDDVAGFGHTAPAQLTGLGFADIDAQVAFSPHVRSNALLKTVADDIREHTTSSVLYSLAFLYQTTGPIRTAIKQVTESDAIFVYGVSDRKVGGIDLQKPAGNVVPVEPSALTGDVPEPFKSEPVGGSGNRMHHKFVVIDFDKPTARVYLGSYNFSSPADTKNGENLLLIRDRRIATAYAVEALRIFDHYHFRVAREEAAGAPGSLELARAPSRADAKPWWDEYYTDPHKIRDRLMFA
jgi:phosphatidylserine/phosphatidylglycerophosphate/cardiolipin synthase-like enzyme